MRRCFLLISGLLAGGLVPVSGQGWLDRGVSAETSAPVRLSAEQQIARGDSLHRALCFQEALDCYLAVSGAQLKESERQALDRRIAAAQNALNMTDFCAVPSVVARQRFSRKDFFLFYPLQAQDWHPSPNPLDSLDAYPLYFPKDDDVVYFSAPDRSGSRSLFVTEDLDSLWRAPRLAGESLLSLGSEIYPMLSPDRKTLYFASDGLFGMGGFDLYASAWDEENYCWGDPVNLGFPFSSPADDFLLMDTEDGKYTLFASNRDCGADSVYVYVLEHTAPLERRPVRGLEELRRIVSLRPKDDPSRLDNGSAIADEMPGNATTRLYMRMMDEARMLRDSIYQHEKVLDALRVLLSQARDDETADLTARIRAKESLLPPLRQQLEETNQAIRQVEQRFLQSGVASSAVTEDRELVGADQGYTFSKKAMGHRLRIKVGAQQNRRGFRVSPVGRFAPDNTLPAGLVYQIQLFSSPRHANLDELKGLSPVYERLSSNLRYTYSVGLYPTYVSALLDLNVARKRGFPEAHITAYRDGRPIPVRTARQEE